MPRRKLAFVVVLSVAIAAAGGTLAARWNSPKQVVSPEPQSTLFIDPKELDFGEVWETERFELPVTLENRGAVVETFKLSGSCSCLSVEPSACRLAPGEKVRILIRLNLTAQSNDPGREKTQAFDTTVVAISGDQAVSSRWVIRGTIRSVLGGLPKQLDCGPISDLASMAEPAVLEINTATPLRSLTAVVEPPWASAAVQPIEGDNRLRVTIHPKLPVAVGDLQATVRLVPTGLQGEMLPPRDIKLVIRGLTDVQPDPQRVLLGTLAKGESATAEVAFRSLTGKAFEVEPISPTLSGIMVERRGGVDSHSFGITVRGVDGSQVVPVEFRVRQPNRAEYTVRVEIAYHGVAR